MARMLKQGLDYFPLDTNLDEKVELLEAKYGLLGYAVYLKLLQRIYANSYFLEWNDEKLLLFKKSINVDINSINDIINDCLRWHLFDENKFHEYSILTSKGIQTRYLEAIQRRKEIDLIAEYLLIENVQQKVGEKINVNIYSINDDINSQKKREEKKREERENACARTREEISLELPKVNLDCEIPAGFNLQLVSQAVSQSNYLKNVTSLRWLVDNYDKVISGYYKNLNGDSSPEKRSYSQKDYQELFANLDEVEL